MPLSARTRLTIWAIAALTACSAIGAAIGFAWHCCPASNCTDKSLLLGAMLLLIATLIALFRRLVDRCLKPLDNMAQRCRTIDINHLDQRITTANRCREAQTLVFEYNNMLERLQKEAERIRRFSGDASHELRTPLTILRGETEVALRWAKEPEEFRETLQSNMEEIKRMGRILEDLLVLSKSDAGELHLNRERINLLDIVQEIYSQAKILAADKQIDVALNINVDEEVVVAGDDLRLRQVFTNLITNAIRYTSAGGNVVIHLGRDAQHARISVCDNGIGIEDEHLPHIFERFYRSDEARNRAAGGSGLGLAIAHSIVSAHHGEIKVTSSPGQGSDFTVILPLADQQQSAPQ